MLAAGRVWVDHPLLGVGADSFGLYSRQYGQMGGLRALEGIGPEHLTIDALV